MLPESEISRDIHDIEDGKPSRRSKLPSDLSFEQVVKNTTAPVSSIVYNGLVTLMSVTILRANHGCSHAPLASSWTFWSTRTVTPNYCSSSFGTATISSDGVSCHPNRNHFRRHGNQTDNEDTKGRLHTLTDEMEATD